MRHDVIPVHAGIQSDYELAQGLKIYRNLLELLRFVI